MVSLRHYLALSDRLEGSDGKPVAQAGSTGTSGTGSTTESSFRGSIDYNAASNTLTILATRQQQKWVKKYLAAVDVPECQIGMDVLFVESSLNPSESFGVDLNKTLNGFNVTGSDLKWGTLDLPALPTGVALKSSDVQASLYAWVQKKQAQVLHRPSLVTRPDQEVIFKSAKTIPTLDGATTTALASGTQNQNTTTNTLQTSYMSGAQSIGTTVVLRAVPVRKDLIDVTVRIIISSPDTAGSGGETLTGRVRVTETNYEGSFKVEVGKTLAIGGLERVVEQHGVGRAPGLGAIPVLGFLFKHKEQSLDKTHITMFVTPRVIEQAMLATAAADNAQREQLQVAEQLQKSAKKAERKAAKE